MSQKIYSLKIFLKLKEKFHQTIMASLYEHNWDEYAEVNVQPHKKSRIRSKIIHNMVGVMPIEHKIYKMQLKLFEHYEKMTNRKNL